MLQGAWTEPRQFLFWLVLLGGLGFLGAGAFSYHHRPSLPLALVARGCIVGVVLGLPAFILAWVPPIRRFLVWVLGRRVLLLVSLAIMVTLFYAVENWRGRHGWQQFQREWEAKGERFDLARLIPPPVPKEQNFFETPLWQDLRWVETNRAEVWKDATREEDDTFSIYGPDPTGEPSLGYWAQGDRVDLGAWQGLYRGESNRVFLARMSTRGSPADDDLRRRYGPSATNYFPIAKEPQSPAADVLLALSKYQDNRGLLIAGADRPQSRFWLNYGAEYLVAFPHLTRVRTAIRYLALHGTASFENGDRQTALQDVKLMFRLLDSVRREPLLHSHFVRAAGLQYALQPVWEGLADRRWTAADLETIEQELNKLDFVVDYRLAQRGELVRYWLSAVDCVRRIGVRAFDPCCGCGSANKSLSEKVIGCLASAIFLLAPSGWYDQNKTSLARLTEDYLLPVCDPQRRTLSPTVAARSQSVLDQLGPRPYDLLSRLLIPGLPRTAERFAYAQASVDLARVACALECYRLAHGEFPEALDVLAPKFIPALPHDVINGEPLKYRRTDGGQFVLYSVGWNGADDGGTLAFKYGRPDSEKGDWVWKYVR